MKEDFDEVKLKLEIPNFSYIMDNINNGDEISSKLFDIGRSEFSLRVFPNGNTVEEEGFLSAFLRNECNHDIVVDYIISVEEGESGFDLNSKIEKKCGKANEVGTDLNLTVEVKLKQEDISGGLVEENMDDRSPALKIVVGPFCPTCKITFMGRDFDVEAFTREIFGDDQI